MNAAETIDAWLENPDRQDLDLGSIPQPEMAIALADERRCRDVAWCASHVLGSGLRYQELCWIPNLDALTAVPGTPVKAALTAKALESRPEIEFFWSQQRPWGPDQPWLAQHLRWIIDAKPIRARYVARFARWAPPGSLVARVLLRNILTWTYLGSSYGFRPFAVEPLAAAIPLMTTADARTAFVVLVGTGGWCSANDRRKVLQSLRRVGPALINHMGSQFATTILPYFLAVETCQGIPTPTWSDWSFPDLAETSSNLRIHLTAYQHRPGWINPFAHVPDEHWAPFIELLLDLLLTNGVIDAQLQEWASRIVVFGVHDLNRMGSRVMAASMAPIFSKQTDT